jgi:hypothetical protein
MFRRTITRLLGFAGLALLVACGGGGTSAPTTGTLSLKITDGPFPDGNCVTRAIIEIDGVEARMESGWVEIPLAGGAETVALDLLTLTNGIDESLALGEVPVGAVDEIRLHIVSAELFFTEDEAEQGVPFKVPSGMSSGLKLKIDPALLIAPGQVVTGILDVDLSESFHTRGLGGDPTCEELQAGEDIVIFSPVVRVLNQDTRGIVTGIVYLGSEPLPGAEVLAMSVGDDPESVDPETTTMAADGSGVLLVGEYALLLPPGVPFDLWVDEIPMDEVPPVLVEEAVMLATGEILSLDLVLEAVAEASDAP